MLHSRIGKPSTSDGTSGLLVKEYFVRHVGRLDWQRQALIDLQDVLLSNELDLAFNLYARQ
jgi:hypothetical protein